MAAHEHESRGIMRDTCRQQIMIMTRKPSPAKNKHNDVGLKWRKRRRNEKPPRPWDAPHDKRRILEGEKERAGREWRLIYFTTRLGAKVDFGQSAESEVSPIAAACVAVQ